VRTRRGAIDDTLFRRRGKKVWAAAWFHDGSAADRPRPGRATTESSPAIVVRLPMICRPVAVLVLAKLVIKNTSFAFRLWLARRMPVMLAGALPRRDIHVTRDAAYAGRELKKLPPHVTWTSRQAPPRHHRRQISGISPRPSDPRRNQRHRLAWEDLPA
jgi:hypothetical protein